MPFIKTSLLFSFSGGSIDLTMTTPQAISRGDANKEVRSHDPEQNPDPHDLAADVMDAKDFDEDVNPITLVSQLEKKLSQHLTALQDDPLNDLSDGALEQMTSDITKTNVTLKSSAKFVLTFLETISALSEQIIGVRQLLASKLEKEFTDYEPNGRLFKKDWGRGGGGGGGKCRCGRPLQLHLVYFHLLPQIHFKIKGSTNNVVSIM